MPLFNGVAYHVSKSIPEHPRREIGRILDANGAIEVALDCATHVISNTIEFEGANTLKKEIACVTPYWVERSMELGTLQDPKYFSADKELIFSGVVATSAGIPPGDKEIIIAGIKECGGQWRQGLTRDVTHLFVTNTSSEKYQTAMHFRDSARITILLPHWFDQCWSMQMRLPHDVFAFPDPPYMRKTHDLAGYKAQMVVNKGSPEGRDMRAAIQLMDASSSPAHAPVTRDVWQGRAILLSTSLALDARRRESVETRVRRNGGAVVTLADGDDEAEAVERTDVLVTQYRAGPAYSRALALGKTIGTPAWLFYVERSGVISSPRDRLLHYPVRSQPIAGFSDHEITVTNYQGEGRDYLKKLIEVMGAKFTPTMTGRNTIVIAAFKSGVKTTKAEEWSVPIVTHKWLEDCFVEWRNLTPAQKKYLDYAPGVNYGTMLGQRGIGRVGLEEDPELPSKLDISVQRKMDVPVYEEAQGVKVSDKADDKTQTPRSDKKRELAEGLTATATSAREAREVEDVLDVGGNIEYVDAPSPVDEDQDQHMRAEPLFTPSKIGPPRGVKKTPSNPNSSGTPTMAKFDSNSKSGSAMNVQPCDVQAPSSCKGKERAKPPSKLVAELPKVIDVDDGSEKVESHTNPLPPQLAEGGIPGLPGPSRLKSKPMVTENPVLRSDQESGENRGVSEVHVVVKDKPLPGRTDPTRVSEDDDDKEDAPVLRPKSKPKPRPGKKKISISVPDNTESDVEMRSRVEETPPRVTRKPSSPKKYKSKAKKKSKPPSPVSDPESEDSVEEVPPKRKGGVADKTANVVMDKSEHGSVPSPNRIVSVELPDPRSLLSSIKSRRRTPERRDSGAGSKSASSPAKSSPTRMKALVRTTSIRVAAYEAPSTGTPKKRGPALKRDPDERHSHSLSPSPLPEKINTPIARTAPSISSLSSTTSRAIQRTPSRRSAAAAASQKLRDEVMPDVINFENELRHNARTGRRRKTSSTAGIDDKSEIGESEGEDRGKKKRKIAPSGKGKSKAVRRRERNDESDRPAVKFITHVQSVKRPAHSDNEDSDLSRRNSPGGSRKKIRLSVSNNGSSDEMGPRKSSCDPKKIRIMTTKVEIREDVCKALVKLGVKFTEKPMQCTHLVASSFARTEKFLCALSNAPFVLSIGWLLESCDKRMVLAERDYLLKDPAMEKKHNFKLTEALERANELKRKGEKLLQGHFFYFTANVPVDFALMKNVIQANGAECIRKTPTTRNLSSTRHVVSCPEDEKIWRPLAKQGFAIYSSELILMAACAQFVDWDGKSKRVVGSL